MATSTTTTMTTTVSGPVLAGSAPVRGKLRYISKDSTPSESPHLLHLPPTEEFADVRWLPVTDIKSSLDLEDKSPYKLDIHGFTARRHTSKLHSAPYSRESWNDERLLRTMHNPEIEELVKQVTGCKTVLVDSAVLRSAVHTEVDSLADTDDKNPESSTNSADSDADAGNAADPFPRFFGTKIGGGATPAPKVHCDYTPKGARIHIRKFHHQLRDAGKAIIEAEDALLSQGISASELPKHYNGPRWALFSIWRPLKSVTRDPLGVSDCHSFSHEDYIPLPIQEHTGKLIPREALEPGEETQHAMEGYVSYGSDRHKWYWISNQQPEDVILIQLFDTLAEKEGRRGVMHSSFEMEGTEGQPARESLETRLVAIW